MIIHRDYTSASNSIIKIFSDHIQFFNPGILPDTITIEQLRNNQYISTPRNRQIAKIAKEMGLIERYGKGNNKISMNELSVKIGISKRKILDNINKLKEMNLLDREGNNKTGHWKIVQKNR
jgi:predicted HTH transcriptional regulator